MELKNERLTEVFKRLEKITGYKIMFTYDDISQLGVNATIESSDIKDVMNVIIGRLEQNGRRHGTGLDQKLLGTEFRRTSQPVLLQLQEPSGRSYDRPLLATSTCHGCDCGCIHAYSGPTVQGSLSALVDGSAYLQLCA